MCKCGHKLELHFYSLCAFLLCECGKSSAERYGSVTLGTVFSSKTTSLKDREVNRSCTWIRQVTLLSFSSGFDQLLLLVNGNYDAASLKQYYDLPRGLSSR